MPAVAVGDGGVPVGPDDEHRSVLVFGRGRRVGVEWPEPTGELDLCLCRQRRLAPEGQHAVLQPRTVDRLERLVVDAVGQVDAVDLGAEHR